MSRPRPGSSLRRAHRSFWVLVAVSVLAVGALSDALAAPSAPATGLRVAGSGLVLVVSTALAARVLLALDRAGVRDIDSTPRKARQALRSWKKHH